MGWDITHTWTQGEVVTAYQLNHYINDSMQYLKDLLSGVDVGQDIAIEDSNEIVKYDGGIQHTYRHSGDVPSRFVIPIHHGHRGPGNEYGGNMAMTMVGDGPYEVSRIMWLEEFKSDHHIVRLVANCFARACGSEAGSGHPLNFYLWDCGDKNEVSTNDNGTHASTLWEVEWDEGGYIFAVNHIEVSGALDLQDDHIYAFGMRGTEEDGWDFNAACSSFAYFLIEEA